MTDFAKIGLATDCVRLPKRPETWNIGGLITVSMVPGIAMLAEALFLLRIGWFRLGLATDDNAQCTFRFLTPLYFAVFSVLSGRERRGEWGEGRSISTSDWSSSVTSAPIPPHVLDALAGALTDVLAAA